MVKQKTLVPLRNKKSQTADFYPYPGYTHKKWFASNVMFVSPYTVIYTEIPATGSQLPCKAETWVVASKILPQSN